MANRDRETLLGSECTMSSEWIFTSKPMPSPECTNAECLEPDVVYKINETNGAVYRCCYACWTSLAVKKSDFIARASGGYSEFKQAKEAWYLAKMKERRETEVQQQAWAPDFYDSKEWKRVRFDVLERHFAKYGHWCLLCHNKFTPLHVDHIKPRSKYPELALDANNLQVLCHICNEGKGNRSETDFRGEPA
jgi:5-methylcytosine-specific restriction endonuclease McrA